MFSNAQTLKTAKSSKKADAVTVALPGIEALASIDAVIKALTTIKATVEAEVKSRAAIEFIKTGSEKKAKPENFKASEGVATASVQLKKRASNSTLSAEEVALLTDAGVSFETVEEVVSTFVINPAYKDDQALLGKVEKALKGVKGIPEDFILLQEGKSKTITTDASLDEVFKLGQDQIKLLLPVVSTIAVKPTIEDVTAAYDIVKELLPL